MTRSEIISRFREECPEITSRVVTNSVLNSWCIEGNKNVCTKARLIVSDGTFGLIDDEDAYDLTVNLTSFFDIDDLPGGGVSIIDTDSKEKRLEMKSIAELDDMSSSWRTASSSKPRYYYRRGKYLHLYPTPDTSVVSTAHVYFVQIPEDFDDDNKTPFNEQTHLAPFHYSIVLYLIWRGKGKVGKREDAQKAMIEYNDYVKWIKREVWGSKHGPIFFRPNFTPHHGGRGTTAR